jgi:hypothetical protein
MWKDLSQAFLSAWKRSAWRAALLVALASDLLGFVLLPLLPFTEPLTWMVDSVTALALWALLGYRWYLLPALVIEVIPVAQLFPAWTLVVAAYAAADGAEAAKAPASPPPPSAPVA